MIVYRNIARYGDIKHVGCYVQPLDVGQTEEIMPFLALIEQQPEGPLTRTRPHKRVTMIVVGFPSTQSLLKQPSRSSTVGEELIQMEETHVRPDFSRSLTRFYGIGFFNV